MKEVNESQEENLASQLHDDGQSTGRLTGDYRQYLTFTVGEEEYGVNIMSVREIKGWNETTRLPNTPGYMKGVINLRGVVIPIFDLRGRFAMGETNPDSKNVVIILAIEERLIGVLVDTVSDILEVESSKIRQAPKIENKIDAEFVDGLISVEDKMVVILNVEYLFDSDVLAQSEKTAASVQPSVQQES